MNLLVFLAILALLAWFGWHAIQRMSPGRPERAPDCLRCGARIPTLPVVCAECGASFHWQCHPPCVRCLPSASPARDRDAIRFLEETKSDGAAPPTAAGTCQVCGTEMKTDVVTCRSCRTPHHRSCWTYLGKCTTFACAEKQFEGVAERASGNEVVFLDERPRRERNQVRVWMDRIADAYRGGPVRRDAPKRGRYHLRFDRSGVACMLEGRRSSHGWKIGFHAQLTPEQTGRVAADAAVVLERRERGGIVLRPAVEPKTADQLQGFFDACLRITDAAAAPAPEARPA